MQPNQQTSSSFRYLAMRQPLAAARGAAAPPLPYRPNPQPLSTTKHDSDATTTRQAQVTR